DGRGARVGLVLLHLLRDDVVAEPDALVADVHRGASDELLHLLLRFAAEGAAQVAVRVFVPPSLHFVRPSVAWAAHGPVVARSTMGKTPIPSLRADRSISSVRRVLSKYRARGF